MKTIYIKQLFIALFLLITSAGMASAAQWQLKNGLGAETPLSFIPGSQDTLRLGIYGNSTSFSAVQVDFSIPVGATMVGQPFLSGEILNGHQLTWKVSENKQWIRCLIHSVKNLPFTRGEGDLICIPVVWASDTQSSSCHTANSVLSTPTSQPVATSELQVSLKAQVKKKTIIVHVSNTEQVADNTEKQISISVIPSAIQKDVQVTYSAKPVDVGTYDAYISYSGNDTLLAYKDTVPLVLTDKKPVEITTPPTATPI